MNVVVVTASAGCGKTEWLIRRASEYMKEKGLQPNEVAFVTFTRQGAEVARKRIAKAMNLPAVKFPHFCTIHSLAFHALGMSKEGMLEDGEIAALCKALGMSYVKNRRLALEEGMAMGGKGIEDATILNLADMYRVNRVRYEKLASTANAAMLWQYMRAYAEYKKRLHKKDYTDLLEEYVSGGLHVDGVKVAFVDEAQDLSPLQWKVCWQAFTFVNDLYVAGDTKQSVYAFAGADSERLLKIRGEQVVLSSSYRVPSEIMKKGNTLAASMGQAYADRNGGIILPSFLPCASVKKGGLVDVRKVSALPPIQSGRSYLFLCRGRAHRQVFFDWIRGQGYNFTIDGSAYLTQKDIAAERTGVGLTLIPKIKRDFLATHPDCSMTDKIRIMTIHASKGDEADVVVLLSDIPVFVDQQMKASEEMLAEERSVFYVAVTRAREQLIIVEPNTPHYFKEV